MKKLLTLTLIGLIIMGCNPNDDAFDSANYDEYIIENTVATNINFMVEEIYLNTDELQAPSLMLRLITEQQYPCVNYYLKTTEFHKGSELIVRFDEIIEPYICLTATGPAQSYIDLPANINKLTLINGNVIDKYAVDITDEKVNITPIKRNFTNSLFDKTFRIPKNSFAYVCGTNTTNTNIYSDFLALLAQNTSFTAFEFIGEGRIPYPEASSGHWVNHPSKYFIYSNSDEFENLDKILDDFSKQNIEKNAGVSIAIYGWNNSKFLSWD